MLRGTGIALVLAGCMAASAAASGREIRAELVEFADGNVAVVEGSVTGYEIVDHVFPAVAGQYLNVSMATRHGANYFNILAPGEDEVAMFIGSTMGNQFEGVAPASGEYKLRVYLMRSAARRNERADYRLEVILGEGGGAAPSEDALVEGTPYHAVGQVRCAMTPGEVPGWCPFGVVREGNGTGSVEITTPGGGTRTVFFEEGKATGTDAEEFEASRQGDASVIRIGPETYEIPDAVVFGG